MPVYGDGLQVRDWLHVEDHCRAIVLALTRGVSGEVYNIGGDCETTNMQIVRTICSLMDAAFAVRSDLRAAFPSAPAASGRRSEELITHVRDRLGHDRRYAVDFAKARRDLGYAPSHDLAAGLRGTVDWYLDNLPWWQALLGRNYQVWLKSNYGAAKASHGPLDIK